MSHKQLTGSIASFVWLLAGISAHAQITLEPIGRHFAPIGNGGAEIAAYDPETRRVFSVNATGARIDVLDVSNPADPDFLFAIDVSGFGSTPNSTAVHDGVVAVAVENAIRTSPGQVVFFDTSGNFLSQVIVGALPDMLTFTPNGRIVLVANEGEPSADYMVDPEGSVSIIDLRRGAANVRQSDVTTASFRGFTRETIDSRIRIFGPNSPTVAQDLEPEYIAVSHNSKTAWVTLQENNALAVLDIKAGEFTDLLALGFKDHSLPGNRLDASDRDDAINIANWPVFGMYQPDGIASFRFRGRTYLVTANEGDGRDFPPAFTEETRVSGLMLDPAAFPNAAILQQNANLGRLTVTNATGDPDGDGDFDQLLAFGTRSFSIWTDEGELVFDSGDQFERITAAALPAFFNDNGNNAVNEFDTRSDNKGPEPEGVTLGEAFGSFYAFIGLERIGGLMVYDLSNPRHPEFVQYVNTRFEGDRSPEGVLFIPADQSPNGMPLLVVSHEVSGTTTVFQITNNQ